VNVRKVAIVVGALFIIATVVNVVGTNIISSALSSANSGNLKIGSLLHFIAALSSVSIAIWLYPILKRYNPYLALTAVVFRTIEAVFYIISAVLSLSFLSIGNEFLIIRDISGFVYAVLAFIPGGIAYYVIFYQTKLIPRWLSVWGILSCLTLLVAVLNSIYNGPPFVVGGPMMILAAPIALQEMVLAVWLIVKGFNKNAINQDRTK
jgi:hypothetical protein